MEVVLAIARSTIDDRALATRCFLGPQLLRSSFAEYTNVQHSGTLPPHLKTALLREYTKLVSKNGVSCSANVCGNRKLQLSVARDASRMLSPEQAAKFEATFQEAWAKPAQPTVQLSSNNIRRRSALTRSRAWKRKPRIGKSPW